MASSNKNHFIFSIGYVHHVFVKPRTLSSEWIRGRIRENEYIITLHADEERRNDLLSIADIEHVLVTGEIIESYPEDRRGVSCLIAGYADKKPVHVVCGRNKSDHLVIITVYVPSEPKWDTPLQRRRA